MLKSIVKSSFEAAGFKISRLPNRRDVPPSPSVHHKVELIFDVGANTGQYAKKTRSEGYRGKIVSFEPSPDAHAALVENAKSDPLWVVHKRAAVGSEPGEAEINISRNSESSSILPMLEAHSSAAPASAYVGKARTEVITLDSVFDDYRGRNERTLLKIDTQGFEDKVL
ncbi:MAG: FkbM family methyltransferase, partial [Xanthobacteraceae bacterium]